MKLVRAVLVTALGTALAAACEVPTDLPILEQRWVIEIDGTEVSVAELLPTGVVVNAGAFDITIDPVSTNETLGNLCSACIDSPFPVPVPTFNGVITVSQPLPADVTAAAIASGSIDITIDNGFSFDPLEDGGSGPGTITVTVTNGVAGPTVGTTSWAGPTDVLTPGGSSTKTLTLSATTIGGTLVINTTVDVPGGQLSNIDTTELLTVTATPGTLSVSSASVNVASKPVNFGPNSIDTEDIDQGLVDHIEEGSIILDIANPFGVSLSGTITMGNPGDPVSKTLTVPATATSKVTLTFTKADFEKVLGQSGAVISGTATASAASPVTITPTQVMSMTPTIDATILIGN